MLPQAPVFAQAQPGMMMPSPTYYAEPSCGYMEPSCGVPSAVSYGPMMDCGCSSCGGCDSCGGCTTCGSVDAGAPVGPTPEAYVDPTPAAE
jgi:hypothetical protein